MHTDTTRIEAATREARERIKQARKALTEQLDEADGLVLTASFAAKRGDMAGARQSLDAASELLYAALETSNQLDPLWRVIDG